MESMIRVECPETGEEIETGMVVEPDFFTRVDPDNCESHCDHCGRKHIWSEVPILSEHAEYA